MKRFLPDCCEKIFRGKGFLGALINPWVSLASSLLSLMIYLSIPGIERVFAQSRAVVWFLGWTLTEESGNVFEPSQAHSQNVRAFLYVVRDVTAGTPFQKFLNARDRSCS